MICHYHAPRPDDNASTAALADSFRTELKKKMAKSTGSRTDTDINQEPSSFTSITISTDVPGVAVAPAQSEATQKVVGVAPPPPPPGLAPTASFMVGKKKAAAPPPTTAHSSKPPPPPLPTAASKPESGNNLLLAGIQAGGA